VNSTKRTEIICISAGCLLVLFAIGWLGISPLFSNWCSNQVISQTLAPAKDLKVILFTRSCGATTAAYYHVSVLNAGDSLSNDDSGNVFVSDASPSLQWKDKRTLRITRRSAEKIFHEQKEITVWPPFKNVRIEYAEK
jgi:hypothetical protein